MKTSLTPVFAGVFALAAFSLLGCSSGSGGSPPGPGSGGSQGGAIPPSGGVSAGGVTTGPTGAGGATSKGGAPASGGQAQGGSSAQGGAAAGGAATSAAGQTATGGSAMGGRTTGGTAGGGSATGGSVAGGGATGGSVAGGGATGGRVTGGAMTGGVSTGGAATGGSTTTGGATTTTGGATGGKTATAGTASGGTSTGGTTTTPIGGSLGSSDGTTPIKVWMAGDSTMAGGPTTACAACPCGYGSQLDPLFNSNVTVVNNAVGGLTIQTWLYQGVSSTMVDGECAVTNTAFNSRWTNMLSGTSAMKAGDYLFISFGINDGDASCPKHVGQAKYLGYLNLMVTAAKDLGVEPILMPPVGAIDCGGGSTAVNIRNPYFTTATNDAGAANNVPVIDLGQLSVDLYNSLGLCPNSADYTSTTSKVGQFFCQDHTHFELAGAKQIAQLIAKALKDQGIGLAAYLL